MKPTADLPDDPALPGLAAIRASGMRDTLPDLGFAPACAIRNVRRTHATRNEEDRMTWERCRPSVMGAREKSGGPWSRVSPSSAGPRSGIPGARVERGVMRR